MMQTLLCTCSQTVSLIRLLSQLTLAYQSHALPRLTLILLVQVCALRPESLELFAQQHCKHTSRVTVLKQKLQDF